MVGVVVDRAAQGAALLERDRELAAMAGIIRAVAAGHGGTVWVDGPAGIGKTRLLGAAEQQAEETGVRVLRARAGALERDFAFGVVRALFEPAVTVQPALLAAGPARLAAPVVTLVDEPAAEITGARLHGLYWLTVALADAGPLLLVLDDAHWADEPSLQALAYLARRVPELPVGIVVAARSDTGTVGTGYGAAVRDDPSTVRLRPGPLSRTACARLVRDALGDPTPAFLAACHDAAGGNPLLLGALLAALREGAVTPDETGVDAVGDRAPAIVAAFVLPRLRQLPPQAGALARAVALLGSGAELRRAATLAGLDPDTAVEVADSLVGAELLRPGRPLGFTHPLIGEAIAGRMSAAERHRGHLHAARCLAETGADPERIAAHLLVVEPLGDQWVVARLRAAAAAALAKGASGTGVTYLRRAAAEPADCTVLPELLVELGTAQHGAGHGDGYRTLHEAWKLAPDAPAAGRIALVVSRAARSSGSYRQAEEILVAAVAALGETAPDLLAALHTELALAGRIGSAPGRPSTDRVGELAALVDARGDTATGLQLRLTALAPLRDPGTGSAAADLAARAAAEMARIAHPDSGTLYLTMVVLLATERVNAVLQVLDSVLDLARRSGRLLEIGTVTTLRAQVLYRLGRLREAEEDARLADRLAEGFDSAHRRHTLAWLLYCLVERGLLDEAEHSLASSDVPVSMVPVPMARARLRLAQDRPAEALADLEECGRQLARREVLHPNFAPWQAWSAVALLRLSRDEEARERAAQALSVARRFGSARAEGLALWASGLVERSAEVLSEAVAVLRGVPAPVERARALIDLGAVLRRANHRADARGHLEEGLQVAHECGAAALVATARLELAAAGVHLRRDAVTGPDALTPAERRIADLAAEGRSNRDIAQTLFVTAKTVENHLGNVYRKLGVTGRSELRDALAPTP